MSCAALTGPSAHAASSAASPVPSPGRSFAACARHGTIVAVDFAHWGGPILRACVARAGSGLALLGAAGFTVSGAGAYGDAFVCRLADGAYAHGTARPDAAEQSCASTPGADAYWSYWLAGPGARHWSYAQLGPAEDRPRPGGIELWNFGATSDSGVGGSGVPRFTPTALRTPGIHRLAGSAVLAAAPLGSAVGTSAGRAASASGGGSSAGLIVGLAVVAGLLTASAWATRRRRRALPGA